MGIMFDILTAVLVATSIMILFNFVKNFIKVGKIFKENKDNPNIQGIVVVNGEIKIIEKETEKKDIDKKSDVVIDPVCNKEVKKEDAYRSMVDEKEYFFCSWECREAFVEKYKKDNI